MSVFEYTFTPDDPDDGTAEAPRTIDAGTVEDAIQILFLRDLATRGVAGTIRVRRLGGRGPWLVRRFAPYR
jgi:hypothetical protein